MELNSLKCFSASGARADNPACVADCNPGEEPAAVTGCGQNEPDAPRGAVVTTGIRDRDACDKIV